MKEDMYDELFEEKEEKTDYRALFFRYIIRWPWFVASVIVCLLCAWLYLRYATPMYNISATILIKDDKKGGAIGGNLNAFEDIGIFSSTKNIDNEIEILRSKSLIKTVVNELGLYINYSAEGNFHDIELYNNTPILVHFSSQDAERMSAPIVLTMNAMPGEKLNVSVTVNNQVITKQFDKLPAVLPTMVGTLTFTANSRQNSDEASIVNVMIVHPLEVAKGYAGALTIEPTSKTTSVATVSLKNTNRSRGEDFINKLIEIYNRNANDDKNEVAENTARFIDERIAIINAELGTTEQELENFKRSAGLTNLSSDAQLAISERSEYEKRCVQNGTQLNLIKYLTEILSKADNTTLLPANVGLEDESLSKLISQYNALILERNRLLRTSSPNNPVIRKLDSNIGDLRSNLTSSIASVHRGLLITQADLNRQENKFAGRVSNAPAQERQFVSIQRQQEIKAGLYLMLLQKREENNITLAATANNAKIIDDALANSSPVSPKGKMIYLIALVLGLCIPIGIIYLINLFRFRIEGRADVESITNVPIIGDIPLAENENEKPYTIAVRENENNIMTETFRSLRTNLLFMLDNPDRKVILITSTMTGEGKTFIASNLAVSLALLGKKVIIIGLDIRKPGLNKVFQLPHKEKGITQFLSAPLTTDLHSLIQTSDVTQNLSLLPGGTIPPNPTELLARPALEEAINQLRREYDYIVMDTAPIGMVTDTQTIARVADISIYVCRADYTHKNDYQLINELQERKRLPSLCTVINGLDMNKKKYGYYYGYGKYGKYYGYGKKYGYGYGYGYGKEPMTKQK